MAFAKGLKPSTPSKVAHRLGAHLHPEIAAALAAGPKGSANLTPCQRMDQGQSGTCHSHSCAASIWTAQNAKGNATIIASPLLMASTTYADVQRSTAPAGQPMPPLQDTGAELQEAATAVAKWGIAPIHAPTADGRFSDVPNDPPDNSFPEPDIEQLQIAGTDLISGEYQIAIDSSAPKMVAASLDAAIPVWVGFYCDSAFEALGANDIAPAPNLNDPNGGGHAVYLSAYRAAADGSFEYLLQNSWGSNWASNGAVWCSTAWLMACWNLWPMAVVA